MLEVVSADNMIEICNIPGADPRFPLGGGGGVKDYVPARTLPARNRTHFWLGLFKCSLVLSEPFFFCILIKNLIQNIVDPILGGGGRQQAPPWIRHCILNWDIFDLDITSAFEILLYVVDFI